MVKRIDPHTHSAYSDGTDTPAQLLAIAAQAGLDAIALTDHDTTTGWDEAAAAVTHTGVSLIRGAEMSCSSSGITVHLLAYLFDPASPGLVDNFRRTREDRETRAVRMVENLSADYPITWEDVLAFAPEGGPVGRPHIADALVAAGAFPDRSAAFVQALHPSGPYYVHHWAPDPVEAVRCVRQAGGGPASSASSATTATTRPRTGWMSSAWLARWAWRCSAPPTTTARASRTVSAKTRRTRR